MKTTVWVIIVAIFSCCQGQETETIQPFTPENAAGLWVPFEVINDNGALETNRNNLVGFDFFAPYQGSVKLNPNGSYFPFIWMDTEPREFIGNPPGNFELRNNRLYFLIPGQWEIDFELIKFTGKELWLRGVNYQVKFKKV
jgi:hypothetical protein